MVSEQSVNARTVIKSLQLRTGETSSDKLHQYQCIKETAIRCEHLQREFISLLISKKEYL